MLGSSARLSGIDPFRRLCDRSLCHHQPYAITHRISKEAITHPIQKERHIDNARRRLRSSQSGQSSNVAERSRNCAHQEVVAQIPAHKKPALKNQTQIIRCAHCRTTSNRKAHSQRLKLPQRHPIVTKVTPNSLLAQISEPSHIHTFSENHHNAQITKIQPQNNCSHSRSRSHGQHVEILTQQKRTNRRQ